MKSRVCVSLVSLLCSIWLTACRSAAQKPLSQALVASEETARISKVLAEIMAADNASDVERIVALYAEDAMLLPPSGPRVAGKTAIRQRYQQGFEKFRLEVSFLSEETQVTGDWAFDRGATRGRNVWHDGKAPTQFEHKYLMILKRQADGNWKIARLIWNGNRPE